MISDHNVMMMTPHKRSLCQSSWSWARKEKLLLPASQAIPRSHCHIMLIPSTQPYCALLCIPNLIEFLVYNPIYPKQYTPTVQTGEIAVNGWASHRLINPHRHLIIEWILASSTTTVLKPRHLKLLDTLLTQHWYFVQ